MGIRITAPSEFDGVQTYGVTVIPFVKGVAEVEDLPAGVELYMRGAGYQVEKAESAPEAISNTDKTDPASTAPADPPAGDGDPADPASTARKGK